MSRTGWSKMRKYAYCCGENKTGVKLTVRSLTLASLMPVMLVVRPPPGVRLLNTPLSRRVKGDIICVMDDMARFSFRGVLLKENARLTRLPNLHESRKEQREKKTKNEENV